MTDILTEAFSKFVPSKSVVISPSCQPWSSAFTNLLLRKKNRNYKLFKKLNNKYLNKLAQPNTPENIVTVLKERKNKAFCSANQSNYANKRAKTNFYYGVNVTMKNPNISAKKKFKIIAKLLKNNKSSSVPPLIENDKTITDPKQKSDILNEFFSSKATVPGNDDAPPALNKIPVLSDFNQINTSNIEVAKIIRNIKHSQLPNNGILKYSCCNIPF